MIWPAFVWLKRDELLSSWMVRLGFSHSVDVSLLISDIWPEWNGDDIDKEVSSDVVKVLAANSSISSVLIQRTFNSNNNKISRWLLPVAPINRAKNRYGLMVCPNCLKNDGDDPYHRRLWRMGFTFLCLECQCYLIDRCPSCQAPLSVFNHKVMARSLDMVLPLNLCFSCQFDLTKASLLYPKSRSVDLQARLNYIIERGSVTSQMPYSEHLLYSLCHKFSVRDKNFQELASSISKQLDIPHIKSSWKESKGFCDQGIVRRKNYLMISDWILSQDSGRLMIERMMATSCGK